MPRFSLIIDVQMILDDSEEACQKLEEIKNLILTNRTDVDSVDTFKLEEIDD